LSRSRALASYENGQIPRHDSHGALGSTNCKILETRVARSACWRSMHSKNANGKNYGRAGSHGRNNVKPYRAATLPTANPLPKTKCNSPSHHHHHGASLAKVQVQAKTTVPQEANGGNPIPNRVIATKCVRNVAQTINPSKGLATKIQTKVQPWMRE
jgi:hypothetical protein